MENRVKFYAQQVSFKTQIYNALVYLYLKIIFKNVIQIVKLVKYNQIIVHPVFAINCSN